MAGLLCNSFIVIYLRMLDCSFVLDNLPIPHGVMNLATEEVLYINKAFQEYFGYCLDDIATLRLWIEKVYPSVEYARRVEAMWLADIEAQLAGKKADSPRRVYVMRTASDQMRSVELQLNVQGNLVIVAFIDCSGRIDVERQLLKNEKLLWAVFNQTYQFMGLLLPDGTLTRVNQAALGFINKSEHDVIGLSFWECPWWTHSEYEQARVKDAIIRASHNETVCLETTHTDELGNLHNILFSIKPVYGLDGELMYLLPEGTDITALKQAITRLQLSEERMKLAFDASMDGIIDKNLATNETYMSKRWLQMLGYDDAEMCMNLDLWHASVHPDDYDRVMHCMTTAIANSSNFDINYRIRTKQGGWKHILGRGRVMSNTIDGANRLIAVSSDVTQLIESQHAVQKSEQQLRLAHTIAKLGSWSIDYHTNTVDYSEEVYQVLGLSLSNEKLTFKDLLKITHPDDWADLKAAIKNVFTKKTDIIIICRIFLSQGEMRYIQSQAHIEYDDTGQAIRAIGVSQDITELEQYRYHLEDLVAQRTNALAQMNTELNAVNEALNLQKLELEQTLLQLRDTQTRMIQSEKMASLGILTAGIAHEINNPLNYIRSGVEAISILKQQLAVIHNCDCEPEFERINAKIDLCIKNIKTGVDKIVAIIKSLHSFSHADNDEKICINLHDTIDSVLVMLFNKYKNHIKIEKNFGRIPAIESYGEQLFQLVMSLISNAIDAIEKSGIITIETKTLDSEIVLQVCDNGVGMNITEQKHLFEPFFTTKQLGVGTGLGLAISYSIVQRHGGRIEVDSKLGCGSRFSVYLPFQNFPPINI